MKLKNFISKMSRKKRILVALGLLVGTAGIAAGIVQASTTHAFDGELTDMYQKLVADKDRQGTKFTRTSGDTVAYVSEAGLKSLPKGQKGLWQKDPIDDGGSALMYKFGAEPNYNSEMVSVFYSNYGKYTDAKGKKHNIGVMEQVSRNNHDALGVVFPRKHLGVYVYTEAGSDTDWTGSVNTRIVFYETKSGKKSTKFNDYKPYEYFKAPIYVRDIDVGQLFELNGADNRNHTAVYTYNKGDSTWSGNSKIMDIISAKAKPPRVAAAKGINGNVLYYGAGRSNSNENSDSVDTDDPRGQLGILLTADTSKLSGVFGITNGKTYVSNGNGGYVYENHHRKVVPHGIRYSNHAGKDPVSLLDYYKNLPGVWTKSYSFDKHQGTLKDSFNTTIADKINKTSSSSAKFGQNYLGFSLGDDRVPDPSTTTEKQVQTASHKAEDSTAESKPADIADGANFSYKLIVNTGTRGSLTYTGYDGKKHDWKPKYTELTTTDNMYGVKLDGNTKTAINITGKDGKDVTNLFYVTAVPDEYKTRVEIRLKPGQEENSNIYDTDVIATVKVKADAAKLAKCAKDKDKSHNRVKVTKAWQKSIIHKEYTFQNQSKTVYKWDKIPSTYTIDSEITYTRMPHDEKRPDPHTLVSVQKQVYANDDLKTNIDKYVNKATNIIYNNNDKITYKITVNLNKDVPYDKDNEDDDWEGRYFSDFTLTDQINDMQGLKVDENRLTSDNSKDVENIHADIDKNNKLTFTGTFKNRKDKHTVTIYVTGRPVADEKLKDIYNTAKFSYHSKADGRDTYFNSFAEKDGKPTDSNKTWYQARKLPDPHLNKTAKEVDKDGNETDVTATTTTFNKVFDYQVTATSGRVGGKDNGKMYITDNDLDSRYQILRVSVMNQTENKKVAEYNADHDSNDYSKDGLTVNGNTVKYVGPAYADKGTQYLMTIRVKYVGHQVRTDYNKKTNNTAYGWVTSEHENPGKSKASYTVDVIPEDPEIVKYVKSIDNGSSTQIMNANSTHTVHYAYDMKVGNMHEMTGFKMNDTLPENMELLPGLKLTVTYQDGYDGQQAASELNQNDWKIIYKDRKLELDLIKNEAKYTYATIHVDYQASVADHADWSDYATRKANSENEVTNGQGVLLPNYIMVPNTVVSRFKDDHTLSSTAYVREQRKELEVKQTITQDNTNYTTSQDKSHYLPKTRSDKTAVTTRLEIQMPNYLKISDFSASSTPDKAKMDKGNTHFERFKLVNSDNPDLTNATLGLPDNKQEMSGKQYYYYTKYSPKTKYYENYAKLDKMWDKFNGQVTMKSNEGTETKHANDVKIHLPNIYSYKDITSVITYPDNKTAKIVVYGRVKGLAVDSDNPTNFQIERKAYDEPNTVTGQVRSSGGYVSTWGQIDLANGLKTGQTGLTTQTYNNIDVNNLTGGSDSFTQTRTYKSASTLTEKLGHSVVLTSNNTGDDYKIGGNKYKSLTDVTTGTDPKRVLVTGQENKDVFGDDTDNRNQTLIDIRKTITHGYVVPKDKELKTPKKEETTPHEHVTYYDIDKGENYVRNYEEGYMFAGPDEVSAKAGYGLRDTHTLYTWTYDDKTDYDINAKSLDGIFSSDYIKNANNETLDYDQKTLSPSDYAKVFNAPNIASSSKDGYDTKTTFDKTNASYSEVIGLKGASESDKALIEKNEKIISTTPSYHLRRFDLKYARRHLLQGVQTLKNNGTDGGYANYIRDYDANKDTKLTYSSKAFGTLTKMKVNAGENLHIYGHRSLTKHGTAISNKRDEIILNGSMSGHTAADNNSDLKKFLESNTDDDK